VPERMAAMVRSIGLRVTEAVGGCGPLRHSLR
jgi:hypothetical protein